MEQSKKAEILDAFDKLSAKHGIERTTIKDVADFLKISVGSIYLEFKNKNEIIELVGEKVRNSFLLRHDTVLTQKIPAKEKLWELTVGHIEELSKRVRKDWAVSNFTHQEIPSRYLRIKVDLHVKKLRNDLKVRIIKVLEEGINNGEFHKMANIPAIAEVIVDAFECYRNPHSVQRIDHDTLMISLENMFQFVIRALR
jgi:AcrR family transcriptional regulator